MISKGPYRARLLALAAEDERVRRQLVHDGSLSDGYHPGMAEVHLRHAQELAAIVAEVGWPGRTLAGEDGAEAAWRVLQHAIGSPALQRECLPLLEAAAARGDVPASYPALLVDRIAFCERRPQRYGTQFDWDRDGRMSVWPIADPETVDQRRAIVGLPPLADAERQVREQAAREGEVPPSDYEQRQREMDHWAGRVGWLATSGERGDA